MKKYLNKEFLLSNKDKLIKVAAIIGIIAVAFFVFVLDGGHENDDLSVSESEQSASVSGEAGEETEGKKSSIIVDVGGAVATPQVVELRENSRVADAITAAGGLKENADTANINQAAFLTDGEKVYIPAKGEETSYQIGDSEEKQGAAASGKININAATSEQLQTLSGVGPATAEKILDYRKSNGNFKKIEDLKNVNGIGDKTFEKLKEHITV